MYERSEEEPQGELRLHQSPAVSAVLALSAGLKVYGGAGRGSFQLKASRLAQSQNKVGRGFTQRSWKSAKPKLGATINNNSRLDDVQSPAKRSKRSEQPDEDLDSMQMSSFAADNSPGQRIPVEMNARIVEQPEDELQESSRMLSMAGNEDARN